MGQFELDQVADKRLVPFNVLMRPTLRVDVILLNGVWLVTDSSAAPQEYRSEDEARASAQAMIAVSEAAGSDIELFRWVQGEQVRVYRTGDLPYDTTVRKGRTIPT